MRRQDIKVAALGDNCIDIYPNLGRYYCSGNAVDFAVHMRRLGLRTSVISTTGNDVFGKQMIRELADEGIDISHLNTGDGPTAVSYMDLIGRERTYGEYAEGVMANIEFSDDDIEFAKKHDLIHTALWGNAERHIPAIHESGALISFDYADERDNPIIESTLPYVDYAFFSRAEDDEETRSFLADKTVKGVRTATATLGAKGSLSFDGRRFYRTGIRSAEVVNTVGAGDSFIAGFMYGILKGYDVKQCQECGAAISAEVVSIFDPWERRKMKIVD